LQYNDVQYAHIFAEAQPHSITNSQTKLIFRR